MAKLVILKSVLEKYYDDMIEKSTSHKYIRRVPKSSGKGYNYFYPEDFKRPMKALDTIFGLNEEKVDNAYKTNNIQSAYGVTKQGFAQHILEYLTNRKTWNTFFANKSNRDRYKIPEKPVKETEKVTVSEKEIVGGKTKEKLTVEEKETKEKNFKSTWNRSLMRKIYSMYNSVPEDKAESKPGIDTIKVGDKVSYNGRTGEVTKDFENGMVFIKFENGGMGRFFTKDLQKMNPTAAEVTESATENADEQNVNGTNEAVKETLEDYYAGGVVESTREKLATEKQYTPYDVEFYMNRSEDEIKADLEREKSRKIPNSRLIAALEGALSWHQIPDETVKENPYNSVGADIVKDYTEKLDKVRNADELTDKQKIAVIRDTYISEFVKISVDVANKTSDTKEQAAEKARQILDAIKNNMPESEQALFRSDYNFDRLVDLKWDKNKPTMEELRVRVADEFVEGKKKYLNAVPLASNNARIMFNKVWDNLKDKTRNEQIRGLYNVVKDTYPMSWSDSLKYREQGYTDEQIRFGYINDFLSTHSAAEEHENRSQAMMGNQNARKYGNLSDEANEVIARQNLNVNEEGVVQPSEEEVKASAEFWNRNKAKNYRFQKDQYGNTYMIMDGLDGYFWDKDGKRVDGAEMVHERTYHDEDIPQEPHIIIRHNGGMYEYIYLTPDMKADLELGNTDYQPVDSTYVKPEKDTIREDYISLQDEKTQDKLKNNTYQMNKLYDMAKKTGIQVMEYTGGMMSNHGKITHVVLPIGVNDQNSEQGMFIDKTDKVLVDYAKYLSENVEPTEKKESSLQSSSAENSKKSGRPLDSSILQNNLNVKENKQTFSKEDLESGRISVKDIYRELDNNGDNYSREERLAMQKLVKDYVDSHADEFKTSHGYLETTDDWYVTEILDQRRKYKSVISNSEDMDATKQEFINYAEFKSDKALKNINLNDAGAIDSEIERIKEDTARALKDKESSDERISVKGELDSIANAMLYKKLLEAKEKVGTVSKNDAISYYVSGDGMWINKYLRNPEQFEKENGKISDDEKQAIADLDKETTSTPVTDRKLYRSVDASAIFGDISDGDFDDLIAHIVYGNNEKLIANNAGVLINRAENKQITEKGFMSTTKDKEIAENWDGFTGSNKEVVLELDIPEGMTGKDLAAYDVEGEEQREVLLPRNTDYFIKKITQGENGKILVQAQVLGQHGNHIAMLGNQNARKYGLSEEDELEYNKQYNWYKDTYVDGTRRNNPYSNEEETIEGILKDEADERFRVYGDKDIAYLALKDLYIDTTGKDYTPPAKEEVKPQTEKTMKKEEKKLEKARVDAGLPKPQMFERTSTIDDSTWDPNSKNYRFRDTGYIAGARKEQAALFITRSAKEGVRVNAKEIDWNGIEENPRTAEKLIVKSNIFGDVDWNSLREKGMSGSAAFLIDRIYASAGTKPDENNADARHNYVIALNGLRDRFEDCKTVEDVLNTLSEIKDEINGEYMEIKESPKYNELRDKMKAQRDIVYAKKTELDGLSEQGRKNYDVAYQKVVEKFIEKGKKEKKLRWNTRVSRYNIPKEYEDAFGKETKDLYKNAYAPWEKGVADFKAELKARGVPEEDFYETNFNGQKHEVSWYDLWRLMPEMKEYRRLGKELDDYVEGAKIVVAKKNPLLEAWKTLGSKFMNITRSDTFAQHRYDCKKGKYDDWSWAEKEVTVKVKKQSKEKKVFNFLVAEEIERKGGRNIDVSSTADLKKAFNLRDVQSGNWVLKDPESADFHVRNAARAFADLADITGIPDDKISLNGRLAMAFGARGTGNAGGSTAMAHYEHEERVINLTKFKGGGCLGHEWFHAFDNLITCAMNGDNASDIFLTNRYSNLTPATKALVLEYLKYKDASDYMGTYRRGQLARKLKAKNFDVAELNKPQSGLQLKVQNAFDELVKAMTTGTTEIKSAVVYSDKDYKDMLYNFKEEKLKQWRDYDKMYSRSKPTMQVAIADAGNLNDAVKMINARYGDISDPKTLRQKGEWIRLAAAYYDRNPSGNKLGNRLIVDSGKTGSQFLADAFDLDENGEHKDYWSTTHEMAARAFSAYIEDTLAEQGRKNDYLSYKSDNKYYDDGKPYPEGEERKKINAAFKKLFEVIRENNAIEKAVAIVDAPDFIIKNGRFLIRK